MDLEEFSVSSSSTALLPWYAEDNAEDLMVNMELEAAEALADLAHLAMIEKGGGVAAETAANWGWKGKGVRKRVKSKSPHSQSGSDLNPVDPEPSYSDPVDERAILDQQQDQTTCSNILIKPVKAEKDSESVRPSSLCTTRCISMAAGRSRQNLTEAEKEERRIRRILANRESARQTIRRRQALCEELTRKAADLSQENESLKRAKELAMKEYQCLETINKQLKAQVAEVVKAEVGETRGEVKSAHAKMCSSPCKCPLLLYNHHDSTPLGWRPSIIQSSRLFQSQHGLQNAVLFPSNISTQITGKFASSQEQEQENLMNSNLVGAPLYLVPCPWFFPFHDNGNRFQAPISSSLNVVHDETSIHNGDDGGSSSKTNADGKNHHFLMPRKVKNEISGLTEARNTNDLNDIAVAESPKDGGCQQNGGHTRESTLASPPPCSVGGTFIINHDNVLQSDHACQTEAVSKIASRLSSPLPEMKQEPVNHTSKKLMDTAAAAEARKRRKELTKLKNLHGRQCRMQC